MKSRKWTPQQSSTSTTNLRFEDVHPVLRAIPHPSLPDYDATPLFGFTMSEESLLQEQLLLQRSVALESSWGAIEHPFLCVWWGLRYVPYWIVACAWFLQQEENEPLSTDYTSRFHTALKFYNLFPDFCPNAAKRCLEKYRRHGYLDRLHERPGGRTSPPSDDPR